MRKTISVDRLREMTNHYLAHEDTTPDARGAMCAMLESVLFETGRYAGFKYIETDDVEGAGVRRHYFIKEM